MGSVLDFPGVDPADAAVGARLRRWREERNVAAEELAEALSLSLQCLHRAEEGRSHLNAIQIEQATRRLHLPLWALVSDTRAY